MVETLEKDTKQTNFKVKFLISKMMKLCMVGGWLCGTTSCSNNSDQHKIATEQMQNHTTSSVTQELKSGSCAVAKWGSYNWS